MNAKYKIKGEGVGKWGTGQRGFD